MQLIGTGKQRAAKTSRVTVGGTALTFASWKAEMFGEDYVTVNFESYNVSAGQTYDEGILGPIGCRLSFGGDWDAGTSAQPLGTPPGLYVRDDLATLAFIPSRLDATGNWAFAFARLRSANNSGDVKGKITFDCSGMNQGPFTYPTGGV